MTDAEFKALPADLQKQPKISGKYPNIQSGAARLLAIFWRQIGGAAGGNKINSSYRSPTENANAGGAKGSYHLQGRAFDVHIGGDLQSAFWIATSLFKGIGVERNKHYLHVDNRASKYYWYYSGSKTITLTDKVLKSWSWTSPGYTFTPTPETGDAGSESPGGSGGGSISTPDSAGGILWDTPQTGGFPETLDLSLQFGLLALAVLSAIAV